MLSVTSRARPPDATPERRRMLESAIDQVRGVLALLAAELEMEGEGGAR